MDIKELYTHIKNIDAYFTSADAVDVNIKNKKGYTLLHCAAEANDVDFVKELVKRGVIYNVKTTNGKTPQDLASDVPMKNLFKKIRMFFNILKKRKFRRIKNYIKEEMCLCNVRDEHAGHALNWAIKNRQKSIAKLLLNNVYVVFQMTENGDTWLHTFVKKDDPEVINFLLKNIPPVHLINLINRKNFETKSTCLHIACENGLWNVVILLLQHGAIYNIKNGVDATPYDLSKDKCAKGFLKLIDEFFICTMNCDDNIFNYLSDLEYSLLAAVINARNIRKHTMQELAAIVNKDFGNQLNGLLKTLKKKYVEIDGWNLRQLELLKFLGDAASNQIPLLKSLVYPSSEISDHPWRARSEGCCFLKFADKFVKKYKVCRPLIIDENIQAIDDTLEELQFDEEDMHVYYSANTGDEINALSASPAKGYEYYFNLLTSDYQKDVKLFIGMINRKIMKPIQKILESIQKKLLRFPSYKLRKAIGENNVLQVKKYLKVGAVVNFANEYGDSILYFAIKCKANEVHKFLLEILNDVPLFLSIERRTSS